MPIVNLKTPGTPVANVSFDGAIIAINGVTLDCSANQTDTKQTVEFYHHQGKTLIGGEGAYLATVEIPAKTYTQINTGEVDAETGADIMDAVADPLDPNAVVVTLWPFIV